MRYNYENKNNIGNERTEEKKKKYIQDRNLVTFAIYLDQIYDQNSIVINFQISIQINEVKYQQER